MEGPILPPDYSALLARRSVEEEQGLPPQPPDDGPPWLRTAFTVLLAIGAVASVAVFVASLL